MRDGLELGERPAEALLGGVRDGGVERRLRHPDAEGPDARPEEIERFHRDLEATVDLAEHLHGLDADAVEVEPADGCGATSSIASPESPSLSRGTTKAVIPSDVLPNTV